MTFKMKNITRPGTRTSTYLGQTENLREQRSLLICELCHAESFVQLASLSVLEIFSW